MTTADLVINFSGGKDSSAMLHLLVSRYAATHRLHVVFADTGWEQTTTGEWESARDWCRRCASRYNLPLHVVSNPRRTLLEEVAERGKFPSAGQRWCTAHHKRNPIQKWIRNHVDNPYIVNAIGIRAEESPNRSRMLAVSRDRALSTRSRTVFTWYPIFTWPLAKVWNYHEIHDLPIHPVYGFLPRFSCRVCIFHRGRDLAAVRRHDPASFAIWNSLEEQIRFTANPKGSAVALADRWEESQHPKPAVTPAEWDDVDLGGLSQTYFEIAC